MHSVKPLASILPYFLSAKQKAERTSVRRERACRFSSLPVGKLISKSFTQGGLGKRVKCAIHCFIHESDGQIITCSILFIVSLTSSRGLCKRRAIRLTRWQQRSESLPRKRSTCTTGSVLSCESFPFHSSRSRVYARRFRVKQNLYVYIKSAGRRR